MYPKSFHQHLSIPIRLLICCFWHRNWMKPGNCKQNEHICFKQVQKGKFSILEHFEAFGNWNEKHRQKNLLMILFSLLKTYNSFTTDRGFRSNKSLNLLNLKKMLESFKWFYIVLVAGFCWDVLDLHLFGVVWWLLHDNETMGKTLFCCLFILNISLYIQNINGKKQQILFIPYFVWVFLLSLHLKMNEIKVK